MKIKIVNTGGTKNEIKTESSNIINNNCNVI